MGRREDQGFSLIEIIVALGIFGVVLVALLPQLVVGLRATSVSREVTQVKAEIQGQLESMRNLPYHVAPSAGDFVDVLDKYFPDTSPAGAVACGSATGEPEVAQESWQGFVAVGSTERCLDYEPASGSFFRTVLTPDESPDWQIPMSVTVQFLSSQTPPVPVQPVTNYDPQVEGRDSPASPQIGVTITAYYETSGTTKSVTTYTQIAQQLPASERIRTESRVRTLELGSARPDGGMISLSTGLLDLTGTLSSASSVKARLSSVSAGFDDGDRTYGLLRDWSAPPDPGSSDTAMAGELPIGGCDYACWGGSNVNSGSLSATGGLPVGGTAIAPAEASLRVTGSPVLRFGNTSPGSRNDGLALNTNNLVQLAGDSPVVQAPGSACARTAPAYLSGAGFITSTAPGPSGVVSACSSAVSTSIKLFPTDFAPNGVVQLSLEQAWAKCSVSGADRVPSLDYDYGATVRYYTGRDDEGNDTYATVPISKSGADLLRGVDLTADQAGGRYRLEQYIQSWTGLTADRIEATQITDVTRSARVKLPGVLTLATVPVRDDLDSTISLTLGAISCFAEDQR